MQNSINPLQQQLDRLLKSMEYFPLQKNFIIGYIVKDFRPITPQSLKELNQVIQWTLDNQRDQVISKQNVIELIVVFSFVCSNFQKHKVSSLINFYEHCLMQLFDQRDYLKRKYFHNQNFQQQRQRINIKSLIKQHNSKPNQNNSNLKQQNIGRMKQVNPRGESELMAMIKKTSHLAQCPICSVQILHEDISVLTCGHIIHRACFSQCMQQQILNKRFPLKCPFEQCKQTIQTQDIQEYLSKQLLEKYYEFSLHNFVDKNSKNMSWCPTPGCSNAFQFDQHTTDFRCPKCKREYCLKCKTERHAGKTCEQNQQSVNLSEEDKLFMQFVQGSRYKQCPKCKFWVEKSHGCCHMTCRCTFQFCYKCGAKYGECHCDQECPDYYGSQQDQQNQQENSQQYNSNGQEQEEYLRRYQEGRQEDSDLQAELQKMQVQQGSFSQKS